MNGLRRVVMSEDDLLKAVVKLAELRGWRVHRVPDGEHNQRAPATNAGWPDLLFAREGRIVVAELKSDVGRLTSNQQAWLDLLEEACIDTHIWRPCDWPDEVQRVLT